ncbi:hypothetical protein DFH28DRAFT_322687 [Melampsora americana]|nr:hypothetical protein DFH28DRAFT_322687 [Melampsora americana]
MKGMILTSFVLLSIYTCKILGTKNIETSINYSKKDVLKLPLTIADDLNVKIYEALDKHEKMIIHDVRGKEVDFSLFRNGFQYIDKPELGTIITNIQSQNLKDGLQVEALLAELKGPICRMIKDEYGAEEVIVYDTRNKAMVPTQSAQLAGDPAVGIHSDYSPAAAEYMLKNMKSIHGNLNEFHKAIGKSGKWSFVHVWTPVSEMQSNHVAVVDWKTVDPKDTFEVGFKNPFKTQGCRHWQYNKKNKWHYKSNQKPGEFLLYTQYKSDVDDGMTLPHSGVANPNFETSTSQIWNKGFEIRVAIAHPY